MTFSLRTIVLAFVASLVLTAAPAAMAGTYTVYGCRTPTGLKAPMNSWQVLLDVANGNSSDHWSSSCPAAVYMAMAAGRSHVNGDYAEAAFIAPADTTISSYTISRAVRLVPSAGFLYQVLDRSGGEWHLVDGCNTASACKSYGDYTQPSSAKVNQFRHTAETDTTEVVVKLLCVRSGGCPEVWSNGHRADSVWLFHSAITLADNYAPQFASPPSGPLVAPGSVLAGVVPVTLGATDRGSGVYQAMIEVDGYVVQRALLDSNSGLCRPPFVVVVPCQLSASGTIYLDTRHLADGSHSLRLLVTDAAGNTASWGPITISTSNNPCSPFPAAGGMTLHAGFVVGTRKRVRIHGRWRTVKRVRFASRITTSFRHRPLVVGGLTAAGGHPVAGAPLCIAVQDALPGAPLRPAGRLTTNAAGGFRRRLAPGPSRTIFFIHRVLGGAIWGAVHINVRVPVRVHFARRHLHNGQVMTWIGHLPGPRPGRLLALMQVWRGTYWETFERVSVAKSGRWVGRYRFEHTTGIQPYTFRLVVPHQSGYPYAANSSRPIHVVVTG